MSDKPVCTAESPKPKGARERWLHSDMRREDALEDRHGNEYDVYRCQHCGYERRVESAGW